jgi:[protein-PII] uridylyltransferase
MPISIKNVSKNDIFLFDDDCFVEELQSSTSPIGVYKTTLQNGTQALNDAFDSGRNVVDLVHKRAEFIDQLLRHAWQAMISCENLALVAVGGYGRGELHPASDIDLMILEKNRSNKETNQQIQQFLTFLWDIGLEVGHSVRTVKDCISEGRADITVATNIMESRLLAGKSELFESMRKVTGPKKIWPTKKFFKAKWDEQIQRHGKFAHTEYSLEPNLKEGPGGLFQYHWEQPVCNSCTRELQAFLAEPPLLAEKNELRPKPWQLKAPNCWESVFAAPHLK